MNFKTQKMIVILLVSTLVSSMLAISIPKVLAVFTTVKVMPQASEFGPALVVGTEFTITMEVHNVSDLYGFDIQFGWNTSWIEYVRHELKIPVETYPNGILHEPAGVMMELVDEAGIPGTTPGTMAWLAAASYYPAPPFNGNGIAFDMTFKIVKQPMKGEGDVTFDLEITRSMLSDSDGWPILHGPRSANVTIHALEVDAHDVAVVDVTTNATFTEPGHAVNVTVVVENQGDFTETFDVTAYANNTVIGTPQTVSGLASQANETLYFTWDTTGAYGNYTIKAEASFVTDSCDLTDNILIDGAVYVRWPGDVDGDKYVGSADFSVLAGAYGSSVGDPAYERKADFDLDGYVGSADFSVLAGNYGKTFP